MRFVLLFVSCALIATVTVAQPATEVKTELPERVVHELGMAGTYMDLPAAGGLDLTALIAGGAGGTPKAFYTLIDDINGVDSGSMLLDLSNPALGLNGPQLTELSRAFARLRERGVHTTAYLENATMTHYRVAMLCDRVVIADMAQLDFRAPAMNVMFFKGIMDLLGVEVQVTRCGDFKGAVEPFMLEKMSEHLKLHYQKMLTSMNDPVVAEIAARRGTTPEKVRALQKQRLISAEDARKAGLVDEVVPWKGARSASANDDGTTFRRVGKKPKKTGVSLMSLLSGGKKSSTVKIKDDSIVVLHLSGQIVDGVKAAPGSIVSGPTVALARQLMNEDKVKGVVVRVNSPGGSATASEAILLALRDLADKKPVVVSMGNLAASGGYYVSMIGCPVLAEAETLTGSIGVFGMRPNVKQLADAVGVHQEVVALDEDAASLENLFAPWSADQLERIQKMVDGVYVRFQDRILEARELSRQQLMKLAGGRVWSGAQAKALGLVDQIGGLDAAMALVKKKAGDGHAVLHLPKPDSNPLGALGSLLGVHLGSATPKLTLLERAGFKLSGPLRLLLDAIENPAATRVWALLPAEIHIR